MSSLHLSLNQNLKWLLITNIITTGGKFSFIAEHPVYFACITMQLAKATSYNTITYIIETFHTKIPLHL